MFDSIYKDLKYKIRTGGFWMRCILLNVSIFVLINILKAWFTFQNGTSPGIEYYDIIHSVSLSSEWLYNFTHFWVWITHFFVHEGFFHLLWNMLWLYWLANIVDDLIGKIIRNTFMWKVPLQVVYFLCYPVLSYPGTKIWKFMPMVLQQQSWP